MRSLRNVAFDTGHWLMTRARGAGTWVRSASSGFTLPKSYPWNWWQKDMPRHHMDFESFGPVYTCVAIIAQDLSRIPLMHVKQPEGKKRVIERNRATSRLFRKPNKYQTRSDLIMYLARSLLLDGNAYAIVGSRNERNEVESLYPINPKMIWPFIESESGEYFYRIGQDPTTEIAAWSPDQVWVPPRDLLHIRLFTPKHPLIGESPLVAGADPTITGMQINSHNAAFFSNMSRPSGVLRHPGRLKKESMLRIKETFKELTQDASTGDPVVLSEGMDWTPLQMNAVDAELISSYELTERQIFQIFRVPTFLGGDLEKATLNNVESLTRFYLQSCLGFYVDHFEEALTSFFNLPPDESIMFDLERALLRGDMKERMEAYGKAVQNGVFSPNEARDLEGLPPVDDGEEPRVQQQLVPLSFGTNMKPPEPGGSAPPPGDADPPKDEELSEEEKTERTMAMYSFLDRMSRQPAGSGLNG